MKPGRRKFSSCPNCGRSLQPSDNFCSQCGQENRDLNLPLRHLVGEFVENTLHFDTKTVLTIRALLFSPGFLTAEFIAGRRKSYVTPLRLYIFVSFFFFIVLAFAWQEYRTAGTQPQVNKFKFSIQFYNINSRELGGLSASQADSLMIARGMGQNIFSRYGVKQLHRITNGGTEAFYHLLMKNISYTMFVLMPLFALLLSLFYKKQTRRYLESLIHSIHLHAFGFALLAAFLILSKLTSSFYLLLSALCLLIFYFYRSQRKVLGERRVSTVLKSIGIVVLYLIAIQVTLLSTIMIFVFIF